MNNAELYNRDTFNKITTSHNHKCNFGYCDAREGYYKHFSFDNGYEISIVAHSFSYGLELAIIHPDGNIKPHVKIPQSSANDDGIVGYTDVKTCNDILHTIGLIRKYRKAS